MTSKNLWNYYRDKVMEDTKENNKDCNSRVNSNKATTRKSFEYKTKVKGSTPADNNALSRHRSCCFIKIFE